MQPCEIFHDIFGILNATLKIGRGRETRKRKHLQKLFYPTCNHGLSNHPSSQPNTHPISQGRN